MQRGFICAADVGICGADWTVFRRRFDVICGKVFSEPEDFSDRPFLLSPELQECMDRNEGGAATSTRGRYETATPQW